MNMNTFISFGNFDSISSSRKVSNNWEFTLIHTKIITFKSLDITGDLLKVIFLWLVKQCRHDAYIQVSIIVLNLGKLGNTQNKSTVLLHSFLSLPPKWLFYYLFLVRCCLWTYFIKASDMKHIFIYTREHQH